MSMYIAFQYLCNTQIISWIPTTTGFNKNVIFSKIRISFLGKLP